MGGGLRISVCSDADSWINVYVPQLLLDWLVGGHEVRWAHGADELPDGDLCFYLSYKRIVSRFILAKHENNLVVHESDLPKGRGWSPLTWQILEGKQQIPVTLFEASETVDSGPIYLQEWIHLNGNELVEDLRFLQAKVTCHLCRRFVASYPDILDCARLQKGEPTYYRRRTPVDSQVDPDKTIRSQFNLFRVADNQLYPVWFEIDGTRYILKITKDEMD